MSVSSNRLDLVLPSASTLETETSETVTEKGDDSFRNHWPERVFMTLWLVTQGETTVAQKRCRKLADSAQLAVTKHVTVNPSYGPTCTAISLRCLHFWPANNSPTLRPRIKGTNRIGHVLCFPS